MTNRRSATGSPGLVPILGDATLTPLHLKSIAPLDVRNGRREAPFLEQFQRSRFGDEGKAQRLKTFRRLDIRKRAPKISAALNHGNHNAFNHRIQRCPQVREQL